MNPEEERVVSDVHLKQVIAQLASKPDVITREPFEVHVDTPEEAFQFVGAYSRYELYEDVDPARVTIHVGTTGVTLNLESVGRDIAKNMMDDNRTGFAMLRYGVSEFA